MTRAQTLKKLLAHGELGITGMCLVMGGDRASVRAALDELLDAGEVLLVRDGRGYLAYRLADEKKAAGGGFGE